VIPLLSTRRAPVDARLAHFARAQVRVPAANNGIGTEGANAGDGGVELQGQAGACGAVELAGDMIAAVEGEFEVTLASPAPYAHQRDGAAGGGGGVGRDISAAGNDHNVGRGREARGAALHRVRAGLEGRSANVPVKVAERSTSCPPQAAAGRRNVAARMRTSVLLVLLEVAQQVGRADKDDRPKGGPTSTARAPSRSRRGSGPGPLRPAST